MTPWLDSLVVHPVALWLAGILLVFGVTWLRAAGRLLLVVLGLAAGIAAQGHLVETGVMASGISTFAMVVGLAAALALMAGRHPVLARHAELLFLCGFGLAAAETLGEWLQWPIGAVWCALMVGGLLSPALAVALLATALLSHGLALTSPLWSIVLFGLAACLTIRFRPHRGIFDNRLSRATHTQTTMAAGQPAATGPVILRFNSTASAARFQRRLDRAKVPVERLLGPCLAAKIPASMLARWRFPRLAGLVELVPDGVYAGDRSCGSSVARCARRRGVRRRCPDHLVDGLLAPLQELDERQQELTGMCCNFQKAARERLIKSAGLRLMQPPRTAC